MIRIIYLILRRCWCSKLGIQLQWFSFTNNTNYETSSNSVVGAKAYT